MDIRQQVEKDTPLIKHFHKELFIDEMPAKPEGAICSKHGEYTFKYSEGFGSRVMRSSSCMKCESERNDFIDSEILRIEDEKKTKAVEDRILNCGVSKRNLHKTFDTYIASTPEQTKAKALYKGFSDSVCNGETAKSLIVCGSVGTGKTHLASSIVNAISRCEIKRSNYYLHKTYKTCELVKIIDLIRQFKSTWSKDNDSTEKQFLDYYTNIDALIIDEVGMQFGSDTEKMIIFDIIDGRYNNMLPTILISNLALPGIQELIDPRAIDRLREDGGVVVNMSWESHRGLK
jgi:DNA replication protein DnaC